MSNATQRPVGHVTYDNRGRVVLVSGARRGIGRAIGDAFARSGAAVVCLDVEPPSDLPENMIYQQTDVSQEADCERAVRETVERFGGLDVLVNNAGIQPKESYVRPDEIPRDLWDRMLAINVTGYMLMAKHALRVMRSQQSGVVINIASGQAHRTARDVPVYGPTKAANLMQAMQWGVQYAREGIRVVSISPGAIDTPLVRASLEEQGGEAELANRHPLGRLGEPREVAAAAVWLASSDASFITATDLQVDGGLGAFGAFADPYPMTEGKTQSD